jgi:predicted metalloprotease with PDZ domain
MAVPVAFLVAAASLASLMTAVDTAAAQAPAVDAAGARVAPIQYTLTFPAPHTHYVEVSASIPTDRLGEIELMMAVWTPGSYLVREYERNVEALTATAGGRALTVIKSDKNRWKVTTGGAPTIDLTYRVYGHEMSVRTNWIEADFALLNGAPTFITRADRLNAPHEVTIVPASGWKRSMTGLAEAPGDHHYRAPDFDTLVDSPIVIGNPAVYEFTVGGKKHYLVDQGEAGVFDGAQAARDLEAVVKENLRLWGALPYDKYLFLNMITESGGGLEHKNSTVVMSTRWATRTRRAYVAWLETASHEFFHAWNVKRLRPIELGPFDYQRENETRSLWIAEGVTEYYGALNLHRAGLSSRDEYLNEVSTNIDELQTTPGRFAQSAAQASYDAWIKYYRPDENSANTSISYYTKGAVLGFLLDAGIRKATNGAKSLDDVMRLAYQRFAGARGYTPEEFRGVAEQVAGISLKAFWDSAVDGTGELDYSEALDTFGLRFGPSARLQPQRAWLGITTGNDGGRLLITQVRRDGPGSKGGLNVGDEILAIDDFRVRADRLDERLQQYKPGDQVTVLVARRELLTRLPVTFEGEPARNWKLEVVPAPTSQQTQQQERWLRPPS